MCWDKFSKLNTTWIPIGSTEYYEAHDEADDLETINTK